MKAGTTESRSKTQPSYASAREGFFVGCGPLSQSDKREALALLFQNIQPYPALHKDSFVGRVVLIAALNIPT